VAKSYADDKNLSVGSTVPITTPAGVKRTLTVRGIFDPPDQNPLLADVSMSQQGFDAAFKRPKNSFFIDAPRRGGARP
jgi:hypothetical protein